MGGLEELEEIWYVIITVTASYDTLAIRSDICLLSFYAMRDESGHETANNYVIQPLPF